MKGYMAVVDQAKVGLPISLPCPRGSLFWKPLARPASVYALLRLTAAGVRSWNCAGTLQAGWHTATSRVAEACHDVTAAQTVDLTKLSTCNCQPSGGSPETFAAAQRIRPEAWSLRRCTIWQMARCRVAIDANTWARETSERRERVARVQLRRSLRRLEDGLRLSPFPRSTSRPLSLSRSWEIQGLLQPE